MERGSWVLCFFVLTLGPALLAPTPAHAEDEEETDTMSGRHRIELTLGGGMSLMSDAPEHLDMQVGGQLSGRAMVDLIHVRADASVLMPDPSQPERLHLRGDARLLFVVVHDFTWRTSPAGELLRLFGGLGGEIDLPEDVGHLMMSVGFAMHRLGPTDSNERGLSESYGAYAGITARLHFWEIRDELRVAVHGMMHPEDLSLSFDVGSMLEQLRPDVTISNRLYLQAIREGVISAGPELAFSYEGLLEGPVIIATLGVAGTLGL